MAVDPRLREIAEAFHRTTHGKWQEQEGVLVVNDFGVEDVRQVELAPWPRLGVDAAFVNLYALMEGARGMFVADIHPGRATEPQHHLYEQVILVLNGEGTTEIWQEQDARKHVFEWHRGSIWRRDIASASSGSRSPLCW